MKFDKLFNKIMDRYELVKEDAEDIYDADSSGEGKPDMHDLVSRGVTDIRKLADEQPENLGIGGIEENEGEVEDSLDKGFSEIDKIQQDKLETEKGNKITNLINSIKQSENSISKLRIIQTKASDPKKPDPGLLNKCSMLLQNEIESLTQYKNELSVLKPKKEKAPVSDSPASSKPEESKEEKTEKKEEKSEKKEEEKEEKKEKKEEKEEEKPKGESVERKDKVLTEENKQQGTEFYLT